MALEFAIYNENGFPKEHIEIGTDTHSEIMEEGKKLKLVLFLRISDYYEDAIFKAEELDYLMAETEELVDKLKKNEHAIEFLKELKFLIHSAKKENKSINVIAD